ncbi:MAG: DUF692 domain-containing protein [Alphaproteobacteria bacterium]
MSSPPGPATVARHVGIGWRHPHYAELLHQQPPLAFVEVHSENFFAPGGAALAVLRQARETYALSLHGVGLSLGSACGLDVWHLDRLADLVAAINPVRISDHASFARAPLRQRGPVVHGNDLLPVAFTEGALSIMAANVSQVQDRLKRPILVENLSAYLAWADDAIAEPEFFNELTRRTGCGLLLDVNNLVVNALNAGQEPVAATKNWVNALRPGVVGEVHLAGYADGGELVIDDHGSRVHAPVWAAYRHAMAVLGPLPTLIEWDTDIPDLHVLLEEAEVAEAICAEAGAAAMLQRAA